MLITMTYTITTALIPDLPRIPYRKGAGMYEGVVMHATAVYNDTATGERSYMSRNWRSAFVHTFTDHEKTLQCADFAYLGYGAAQTANSRYVHHELCQSHDRERFLRGYDRWTWIAAKTLFDGALTRSLGVVDGVTVLSHAQVSENWHESDHNDPIEYLAEHGKTWADVIRDVAAKFNELTNGDDDMTADERQLLADLAQLRPQPMPDWFTPVADKLSKLGAHWSGTKSPVVYEALAIADRAGIFDDALKARAGKAVK